MMTQRSWRRRIAALVGLALVGGPLLASVPAQAEQTNPPAITQGGFQKGEWNAYVKAGETLRVDFRNWIAATELDRRSYQVFTVTGPGGVSWSCTVTNTGSPCTQSFTATDDNEGIWRIVKTTDPTSMPDSDTNVNGHAYLDWDINVTGGGAPASGRVWAVGGWQLTQPRGHTDGPASWTNGIQFEPSSMTDLRVFYLMPDEGWLWSATYKDYNGINSVMLATSLGNVNAAGTPVYRSVESSDTSTKIGGEPYWLFWASPAADMPETATRWDGKTVSLNRTADPVQPGLTDLECASNVLGTQIDCQWTQSAYSGVTKIGIDVDNNGSFNDAVDVATSAVYANGKTTFSWNGVDGQGNRVDPGTTVGFRTLVDRVAEIHFVNTDVENRRGGISVNLLNRPSIMTEAQARTLYWDDRSLSTAAREGGAGNRIVTSVRDGRAGYDSGPGVHELRATDNYNGWGDSRAIEEWAYISADVNATAQVTLAVPEQKLELTKTSKASGVRAGDTVDYEVTATNIGDLAYEPAYVVDDLTSVLDDAALDESTLAADKPGDISYDAKTNRITWTGDLAVDDAVTITYKVKANSPLSGDLDMHNVVVATGDPDTIPDGPIPDCKIATKDLLCAETTDPLKAPKLNVTKASKASGKIWGDSVDYKVKATNTGDLDYDADHQAFVIDDLTDVLDVSTLDESSIKADRKGEINYDAKTNRITWIGELPIGKSVTVTYKVKSFSTKAGDAKAFNVVVATADPTLVPEGQFDCADVEIPCAETVDPFNAPAAVAGINLPNTGGPTLALGAVGLAAIAGGSAALWRRRGTGMED